MADTLRPASLLLGAVCLWAACVLLLAIAGLGARVADSGTLAQPPPIPKLALMATPSRLGPLANYAEVGQRPLLNADRRPSLAPATEGGSDELDVILTSVLITPQLRMAILTGAKDATSSRVRVGETIAGSNWRLVRLEPRLAVLDGPGGERRLDLRVYDGQGGLPPTALGVVAGGVAPAGASAGANGPARVDGGDQGSGQAPASIAQPAVPRPPIASSSVRPGSSVPAPAPQTQPPPSSQDAQIEAIRRRIEARRAQMRAEAGASGSQER